MKCYLCGADVGESLGACSNCRNTNESKRLNKIDQLESAWRKPKSATTPAGFTVRAFALLIDLAIINLMVTLGQILFKRGSISEPFTLLGEESLAFSSISLAQRQGRGLESIAMGLSANITLASIYCLSIWFIISLIFEASPRRATPGKLALGLRVVGSNDEEISSFRSLARNLAKLLSATVLFIGFFFSAFQRSGRTLHDILTNTKVHKSESYSLDRLIVWLFLTAGLFALTLWLGSRTI